MDYEWTVTKEDGEKVTFKADRYRTGNNGIVYFYDRAGRILRLFFPPTEVVCNGF